MESSGNILDFLYGIYQDKKLVLHLAKNDFKARYANSFLGAIWAYAQPIASLLVIWFVFQVALGNGDQDGYPFITWFAPASLCWAFFSECTVNLTSSVQNYSYLVRKVNFKVRILPVVKIGSSLAVHIAMIAVILIINFVYGMGVSLYTLQIFYYLGCMLFLLVGLGWLLSSITIFAPDIGSIVNIAMSIGFWATPICWNPNNFSSSPTILNVLKILNPVYYIVEGYRDTFLGRAWFWEKSLAFTLSFWVTSTVIFVLGYVVFKKLRPHFADVL